MKLSQIQELVAEKIKLIEVNSKSISQAKERAGDFLMSSAILVTYQKDLEIQMVKVKTMLEGSQSQAIIESTGKNITEKKQQALSNKDYVKYREMYETLEAQRNWLKGIIRIFENAHLIYRQLCRD